MDDNNKELFRKLLHDKFNNNLKEVNEALVTHIFRIERKTSKQNCLSNK